MKKYLITLLFILSIGSSYSQTTNVLWSASNISNRINAASWRTVPLRDVYITTNGNHISFIETEDTIAPFYFQAKIKFPLVASVTNYIQWDLPYNTTQAVFKLHLFYIGTNNLTWTNESFALQYNTNTSIGRENIGVSNFVYSVANTQLQAVTYWNDFPSNQYKKVIRLRFNYAPTNTYTNVWLIGIDQQLRGY